MKTGSLLLVLFAFCHVAHGQDTSQTKIRRFGLSEFHLTPGYYIMNTGMADAGQFRKLAGNDYGLTLNNSYQNTQFANGGMIASLGFRLRNASKDGYRKNTVLRIGLAYYSGAGLQYSTNESKTRTFDTYTSPITGDKVTFDSTAYDNYTYQYFMQQLRLDVNLMFHTNRSARWSLYGGIGLSGGISFNTYTSIDHSFISAAEVRVNGSLNYTGNGKYLFNSSRVNNANGTNFSVYMPLGVDFRIGRHDSFWSRVHLTYELRPGFGWMNVPEVKSYFFPVIQQYVGLKIDLH